LVSFEVRILALSGRGKGNFISVAGLGYGVFGNFIHQPLISYLSQGLLPEQGEEKLVLDHSPE
jgi:hypothetical protein